MILSHIRVIWHALLACRLLAGSAPQIQYSASASLLSNKSGDSSSVCCTLMRVYVFRATKSTKILFSNVSHIVCFNAALIGNLLFVLICIISTCYPLFMFSPHTTLLFLAPRLFPHVKFLFSPSFPSVFALSCALMLWCRPNPAVWTRWVGIYSEFLNTFKYFKFIWTPVLFHVKYTKYIHNVKSLCWALEHFDKIRVESNKWLIKCPKAIRRNLWISLKTFLKCADALPFSSLKSIWTPTSLWTDESLWLRIPNKVQ